MSKLFSELTQEAQKQKAQLAEADVPTPKSDTSNRHRNKGLQTDKLETVVQELSEISVSEHGSPVRMSSFEKKDIEDFIHITLRKKGLTGKSVSSAKLMRYALRYMMKVHEQEFIKALTKALRKEEKLSI